jgi:integrase
VVTLALTGLRFCHASALRWEDIDEERAVIRVERTQYHRRVGPLSKKKRAPKKYPLHPVLSSILREHRQRMLTEQAPGVESGWCFPSKAGTLREPSSLKRTWEKCLVVAGITDKLTVHGLRWTFNDLSRRAGVDAVVTRSLTGHVTEQMQEHYSSVGLDEQRAAVAGVIRLVTGSGMDATPDAATPRAPDSDNGAS